MIDPTLKNIYKAAAHLDRARRFWQRCPDHTNLCLLEAAEQRYVNACAAQRGL